jgi:hypothetical protein
MTVSAMLARLYTFLPTPTESNDRAPARGASDVEEVISAGCAAPARGRSFIRGVSALINALYPT